MTARKYTDAELKAMEAKERDGLLDGNQKRALTAWKKRQAKASEKPVETPEATADAPTQADRAEQALEDAGRKRTQTESTSVPTATGEPDVSAHAEDYAAIGRRAIADRLGILHNAMLGVLSASFAANDKVTYAYACKLLSGELMDIKANYSKDAK